MDAHSLYGPTVQREATLKSLLKTRPNELDEIESLRTSIRDSYLKMLFENPKFAVEKDIEQSLWKTCFYRKIEDYRKKIRKYASAASNSENKVLAGKARSDLHAICLSFGDFLNESMTFYQDLMERFQRLYNNQELEEMDDHDCLRSIHRCLIFLGDLARYRELHSENARKDWSQAEKWYYMAIDTLPTNGNPHNQLAVLATYTEAECVAVYRYCRALLCKLPFPTAKENLTLLFEKNKQSMPDATSAAEIEEEEERIRQGLIAGTITGQQAGIARATMLKSLLQRFVRLHGILFHYKQEQLEKTRGGVPPFPVSEFLSMLNIALLDFRQLLKMSAFGDGLLLHMVVICIFSAVTSGVSDDQDQDSSGQSLALSLAFGVVAEIASNVRTSRQESEHTTAKPPGSRLLGPVVVFCDWIASQPQLWRLKPLGNNVVKGPGYAEKEKEAQVRCQFWTALCKIATQLQVQLQITTSPIAQNLPSGFVWCAEDGRVLKEQHDLRGFDPLEEVYGKAIMTWPKNSLGALDIVSDDIASTWRTVRLVKFLNEVGRPAGTISCSENPNMTEALIFTCRGKERRESDNVSVLQSSLIMSAARGLTQKPERAGEVIVFRPSFVDMGPAGMEAGANTNLDDSSQLPKDVVESMLGGLLDCSDSGPHPALGAAAGEALEHGKNHNHNNRNSSSFNSKSAGVKVPSFFSSVGAPSCQSGGGLHNNTPLSTAGVNSAFYRDPAISDLRACSAGWNIFSSSCPNTSRVFMAQREGEQAASSSSSSIAPAPPGNGLPNMFAGGGYNPFSGGLPLTGNSLRVDEIGTSGSGRHSAPPEVAPSSATPIHHLPTKNPFITSGFMFSP